MDSLIYPILVFLAMAAWGGLHSVLASFAAKRFAEKIFGPKANRYYRLFFVFASVVTLVPVLALTVFLPSRLLWVIPAPWLFLTMVIQFVALVLLVATALETDVMVFAGIRQALHPNQTYEDTLVVKGFYRYVRHPLYFFSIIIFWFFPFMTDLMAAFFLAGTLYFMIGTIPEERKLLETFGEAYRQYRREVPWLIPHLKRKKQ
ncbi:MAG: isoprenylcysteine carboxylmethyltransferase family protein [Anaerolineaceae bacterium]|nr:isoprenylcysteine carboxylmethyltransferase family protein [Anaerolineaceae bacterium]